MKGGYLLAFDLCMGKSDKHNGTANVKIGLGENTVLNLLKKADIPSNEGYKVYFDDYFSSVALMECLPEKVFSLLVHVVKTEHKNVPLLLTNYC